MNMILLVLLSVLAASSSTADLRPVNGNTITAELDACAGQDLKDPPAIVQNKREREALVAQARIYAQSGNVAAYEAIAARIKESDAIMLRLMGAQAVRDIEWFNNACRAQRLLSYHANGQILIHSRTDGYFSLFVRGRDGTPVNIPGYENISPAALTDRVRRAIQELSDMQGM